MFYEFKHPVTVDYFKKISGENIQYPGHIHYCFEVLVITEGSVQVEVDGNSRILHPGEAAFIFPNQVHTLTTIENSRHMLCLFSPDLVSAYAEQYASKIPENSFFRIDPFYMQQMGSIEEDHSRENDITEEHSIYEIKSLLYALCNAFDKCTGYLDAEKRSNILLRQIFQFIEKNYSSTCTLADLAKALGYEYTYLSKYFKNSVGTSYNDYVNRHRISRSCYLLQNKNKSVETVAEECGFRSVRTFSRNFSKEIGVPPSAYQKRYIPDGK